MKRRKIIGLCEAYKLYGERVPCVNVIYVAEGKCKWCNADIPNTSRSKLFCCKEHSDKFYRTTSSVYYASCADSGYRRRIFQRDNYTCQDCGELHAYKNELGVYLPTSDGQLDMHHIIPVELNGSDDPNNLITLCRECHKKRHRDMRINNDNRDNEGHNND